MTQPDAWTEWLFTIDWPFHVNFDPQPPVDIDAIARMWNERDNWEVSHEEAVNCIRYESGVAE